MSESSMKEILRVTASDGCYVEPTDNQEIERLELESRIPPKWEQDAQTLANDILGRLEEWQAEADQESQRVQHHEAGEAVMREYLAGYVGHAFERAEAWKQVALGVRQHFGVAMDLLGECCGHFETLIGKKGWSIKQEYCNEAAALLKKITDAVKAAHVETPDILKEEVQ